MSDHIARLQKLAQAKRNRRNMEKAQGELDNLQELREALEPWLEAAEEISEHIEAFEERFGEIDADYLPTGVHDKLTALVAELHRFLPDQDSMLATFAEQLDMAVDGIDELEGMLDDRDYSAEERDDKWYEATEALDNIATALDELSCLGIVLEADGSDDEEDAA